MSFFLKLLGVLLIAAGIIGGAYLGFWVCFVGGIIQVIEAVKQADVPAKMVALGILRICCAGLVFWITALVCGFFGAVFFSLGKDRATYTSRYGPRGTRFRF